MEASFGVRGGLSTAGFEVGDDSVLIEVIDADGEVVHFADGRTAAESDAAATDGDADFLVGLVAELAVKGSLIKLAGTLQVADVEREVIDAVAGEACGLGFGGGGGE